MSATPSVDDLARDVEGLDRGLRERVAARWLEAAQAEHASVASFNRFSLQLLAVGAPADLLGAAQEAALDEVHHARLCFAIASTYAGEPPRTGEAPDRRLGDDGFDLEGVVRGTIEEGCIGETLAALEAEAARDLAEPETIRRALDRIHRDEARHAELAFRTVRWGAVRDPDLRPMIDATYRATLERHAQEAQLESIAEADLAPHGILPASRRRAVRQRALRDVLTPLRAGLVVTPT